MIKITVNTNSVRRTIENIDESTTTIRSVLDRAGIDTGRNQAYIFGDRITANMMDQTFAECGYLEDVEITQVVKADSAC